jgi:hypothetical protein
MSEDDPKTRRDLDQATCIEPGCDHTAHDGIYLHCADHLTAPAWVQYRAVSGTLQITCAECEMPLGSIAVAP